MNPADEDLPEQIFQLAILHLPGVNGLGGKADELGEQVVLLGLSLAEGGGGEDAVSIAVQHGVDVVGGDDFDEGDHWVPHTDKIAKQTDKLLLLGFHQMLLYAPLEHGIPG